MNVDSFNQRTYANAKAVLTPKDRCDNWKRHCISVFCSLALTQLFLATSCGFVFSVHLVKIQEPAAFAMVYFPKIKFHELTIKLVPTKYKTCY